jgi:hypothetical protein
MPEPEPKNDDVQTIDDVEDEPSFLGELWYFLKKNKKWWMVPMLVSLVLFGVLMLLGGTAAAPFIYTLF